MKKRNLRSLSLNKHTISKLNSGKAKGGSTPCTVFLSMLFCPGGDDDVIINDTVGQSMDCTSTCEETFTCRDWSCDCF